MEGLLQRYHISGLDVASDLSLPGVAPFAGANGEPQVRITAVPEIPDLAEPDQTGPTWAIGGGKFVLEIPGVARYMLAGGSTIEYAADSGGDPGDVAAFILGSVFGMLLHQRGALVLHASAVEIGARAVLFCGHSGAGKSTIAAALNKRGYPLLLDDVCAVDFRDGIPLALPDGRQVKLWTDAAVNLDLMDRRTGSIRQRISKHYVEPIGKANSIARPVAAVYILREHAGETSRIDRYNVVEASINLRRQSYRPALISLLGQDELYFRSIAKLSEHAPVFALYRAKTFSLLDETVSTLEAHWADIGLLGAKA